MYNYFFMVLETYVVLTVAEQMAAALVQWWHWWQYGSQIGTINELETNHKEVIFRGTDPQTEIHQQLWRW